MRGFILDDIYQFRGIPYGASTAGENRFMPPQPPQSWDDVRPALMFGESAPQVVAYDRRPESYGGFTDHWNYDLIGEDCLRLNVWTPDLDGEKRPVLVWLHGGGYSSGNAIEQDGYGGENLARYGNVVCCSTRSGSAISLRSAGRNTSTPATSACSTSSPPCNGCTTTSPISAATRAT